MSALRPLPVHNVVASKPNSDHACLHRHKFVAEPDVTRINAIILVQNTNSFPLVLLEGLGVY